MAAFVEMNVRFAGEGRDRRPVALAARPPPSGARVQVRAEAACAGARSAHLVHRVGGDLVLAACGSPQAAEAARRALGPAGRAYQIVEVEVLDQRWCDAEAEAARQSRWARQLERLARGARALRPLRSIS